MKHEITELLGPQLQLQISKVFLENDKRVTEVIEEAKYSQHEQNNLKNHDTAINSISHDKDSINKIIQL